MKKIIIALILFLYFNDAKSKSIDSSYSVYIAKAEFLFKSKDYKNAAISYTVAFSFLGYKAYPDDRYNAARCWGMTGNSDSAFYHLLRLQEKVPDYFSSEELINDTCLKSLQNDHRWHELIEKIYNYEAHLNKALIEQLDTIYDRDQKYRKLLNDPSSDFGGSTEGRTKLWQLISKNDSLNLAPIETIIDTYGWPGPDLVKQKGNSTVFLVIQHSNFATQKKYLPMMREAVKSGKAKAYDLALLEDRVAMNDGKKQIYGSQIRRGVSFDTCAIPIAVYPSDDKSNKFYPIEDEPDVNKRRASVGLEPLEEYAKRFGIEYKLPPRYWKYLINKPSKRL